MVPTGRQTCKASCTSNGGDMRAKELVKLLTVGTKIKIGRICAKVTEGFKEGQIVELIDGEFDEDNGLYSYTSNAPSIWNKEDGDFESIYHLFGNNLEDFLDCEIL